MLFLVSILNQLSLSLYFQIWVGVVNASINDGHHNVSLGLPLGPASLPVDISYPLVMQGPLVFKPLVIRIFTN